jgi:pyruvate kinase
MVCELATRVNADAIITPTLSGRTARLLARHRPHARIIAPTPSENVLRQMHVIWGLIPVLMDYTRRADNDRLSGAIRAAIGAGVVQPGELVLLLAGHPLEGGEHLPTIRLARITAAGQAGEP